MRVSLKLLVGVLALFLMVAPTHSALISKTFAFKPDVTLELGVAAEKGLRVESVHFKMPAPKERKVLRIGNQPTVDVIISNNGDEAQKVGIAIAMFDQAGRLVGVASGGSKLVSIKPNKRSAYSLDFEDVNDMLARAASFQISVEAR